MSAPKWKCFDVSWHVEPGGAGRRPRVECWQDHAWRSPPCSTSRINDALIRRVLDLEEQLEDYRLTTRLAEYDYAEGFPV